jgi:hypothetical protein
MAPAAYNELDWDRTRDIQLGKLLFRLVFDVDQGSDAVWRLSRNSSACAGMSCGTSSGKAVR